MFPWVGPERSAPEPPVEGLGHQGVGVEVAEDLGHGAFRNVRSNAGGLHLPANPQASAAFQERLGPGNGQRHTHVVERALGLQAVDSRVDGERVVSFAREALTDLRGRQFPARQHLQSVDVGGISQTS